MREPSILKGVKQMGLAVFAGLLMGTYPFWSPILKAVLAIHSWFQERGVEG